MLNKVMATDVKRSDRMLKHNNKTQPMYCRIQIVKPLQQRYDLEEISSTMLMGHTGDVQGFKHHNIINWLY